MSVAALLNVCNSFIKVSVTFKAQNKYLSIYSRWMNIYFVLWLNATEIRNQKFCGKFNVRVTLPTTNPT